MHKFSAAKRNALADSLSQETYDVLIIGGGITGCGLALDAVTRGLRTALIEMQDFASGTSSRSTKLVHGGLRYLKQFEVAMVAEVGKERAIVYENAPHVTEPEWMLLPIYKGGTFGKLSTSFGLRVYDFLASVNKKERRKILKREDTLQREPLLKKEDLLGSGYYVEYRTDDARLTIETAKKAVELGAHLVNYTRAEGFLYENGKIAGAAARDLADGRAYEIRAKKVINAAGPWVDQLREKDGSKEGKRLQHTKGVHIVIDGGIFPLRQAVYFDTPDGRMVFAIPRDGKTYVGTTDTVYMDDLASPGVLPEDEDYLLSCIRFMFPEVTVEPENIESSWAGVRPLIYEEGKGPSEISRKDEIWTSESGLITIAGGKLTGYRKMAETVMDLAAAKLAEETGWEYKESGTKHLRLSGGYKTLEEFRSETKRYSKALEEEGLSPADAARLSRFYGANTEILLRIAGEEKRAESRLPLALRLQLIYAMDAECALRPSDFFVRRTGALYFNISMVRKWKDDVILFMNDYLGWSAEQCEDYKRELEELIAGTRSKRTEEQIF
ncbi:glycerol-3-phosphate dehydrogenase/oxidase [Peribacillus sp. SCS-26]|uniref:glycerol-3-phosphate dehydrogenase/oxidase n=1 Tax=Paraperibacillus marinus TaxID=3115295 RepID=UPI003905F1D9